MRTIGNILAVVGIIIFVYTVIARFVGDKIDLGVSQAPALGEGFTVVGMFSGTACLLLIAVIALLKSE